LTKLGVYLILRPGRTEREFINEIRLNQSNQS